MATNWTFTDDDDDDDYTDQQNQGQQPQVPKALRAHVKKLEKELEELRKVNTENAAKARATTLSDLIKAQGFDPKIANLYPSTGTADETAVKTWLDEYGSHFAKTDQTTNESTGTQPTSTSGAATTQGIDLQLMEALNLVGRAASGGMAPSKIGDIETQIKSAKTKEELYEVLNRQGAKLTP